MNLQQSNLQYGRKGFIYTYDIMMASIVIVIMLLAATFYVSNGSEDKLSNLHTIQTGSDIINIMIKNGILNTLDQNTINNQLSILLPQTYDMSLQITTNTGEITDIQKTIPQGTFIGSGKDYFVTPNNKIAKVEYKIWQKA